MATGRREALAMAALAAVIAATAACAPLASGLGPGAAPPDAAASLRAALAAYLPDLPGYQFRATPVGHFGVGSLYLADLGDPNLAHVDSAWYLGGPDAWLRGPDAARAQSLARLVAEGSLGSFSATAGRRRAVDARAGIAILSAITAGASVDYQRGVETTFQAAEVRSRRLDWAEFEDALAAGRVDPAVARVVRDGRFVVAAADVVLIGYRADVTVDEHVNPGLAASLRSSILLPRLPGASAAFKVEDTGHGHFVAVANGPVVAAVLYKRPPPASKALAPGQAGPAIATWPTVAVDEAALDAAEAGPRARPR